MNRLTSRFSILSHSYLLPRAEPHLHLSLSTNGDENKTRLLMPSGLACSTASSHTHASFPFQHSHRRRVHLCARSTDSVCICVLAPLTPNAELDSSMGCMPLVSSLQCCALINRTPRSLSPASSSPKKFGTKRLNLLCHGEGEALLSLWNLLGPVQRKGIVVCATGPDDSSSSTKISSAARIRSEVISPFRSVRMFFYLAFIASGSIGALISLPRLFAALGHAPNASPVTEVLTGFGIDLVAVLIFVILYRSETKARDLQVAKLSREETLASLKIELRNKRVLSLGQLRGVARLVIVVGPASHIEEACRASEPYFSGLLERGIMVISFATDGQIPELNYASNISKEDESGSSSPQVDKLWRGTPIYTTEWTRWLTDQKQLANVPLDAPVYLSLRLDGRVRGSGTGLPPWGAFVAQLPPMKGMWSGVLDGMDGRI
ncbi:hypothetical protein KP509_32G001900 [Ceratopteris richardii]|uniref:Protein LOW PSII ACCUMULATION 1, chloroplastic n=2 Tax=Ceratopteris richardii TaxID=49495 RepID=A0A8T2QRW6_CERRI|nr:hypothetical protein KP509_32G001900 [Ceratopteris richardii]